MKNRILRYMQEFGSITTFEAFTELGCSRLSEYIRQARVDMIVYDEIIHFTNRYGEKSFYKRYFIDKSNTIWYN